MNNFITLLDHTLNLHRDEKSDEEEPAREMDDIPEDEELTVSVLVLSIF